jgi:signal transduction histidine kinase
MVSPSDILHSKILIVDDKEVNILLLEQMLRDAGYACITSTQDPRQVRDLHLKNHYDLILLDLLMPGMDGFQVMEALKEIEPEGYLPVLVITAQPDHKLQAFESGTKDFICKPFELAEVLARVHNMLEVRLLYEELRSHNETLRRQLDEQATLLAISLSLVSTPKLQPHLILDQLRKIIEYDFGALFALEGSSLVSLAIQGTQKLEQIKPLRIPLNSPVTIAVLFNEHRPMRIADVWSDDLAAHFLHSLLDGEAAVLLKGMKSWMWVPLAVSGRLIGGISVMNKQQDGFTSHHADLALNVANQVALTMINMELYGKAQALAVMEERQRLARDLHDAVNQSLFSASLIAEALPRLWDMDQQDARRSLEELRHLTRGASAEMRLLLAELRPSTLTDSRLSDLLRQLGNAFSSRNNFPVDIKVTGESSLPSEVQIALYRICQETLTNIAKHANASHVDISLQQDGPEIELRIYDDGQGFDTDQIIPGHYGLGMMRERAGAVGAQISVLSPPGQGTEIKIHLNTTSVSVKESS